jgi:hypothetical protein
MITFAINESIALPIKHDITFGLECKVEISSGSNSVLAWGHRVGFDEVVLFRRAAQAERP